MRKTKSLHPAFTYLLYFLLTATSLLLFIWLLNWLLRPDLTTDGFNYSAEKIQAAEKARDITFDPNPQKLPTCFRQIDYTEGTKGNWFPRGESPILQELVDSLQLPPVAERVGTEPLVLMGCDNIGKYGGTWLRIATSLNDTEIIKERLSYSNLLGWSPLGYPITPRVAKKIDISKDNRQFIVTLRKGMKWSDGHPFAANDIIYWWEHEINNEHVLGTVQRWMTIAGQTGTIEKIDDFKIKFSFPVTNGIFKEILAIHSWQMTNSPEHYLRQYHPTLGDSVICEAAMQAYQLPGRRALYAFMKKIQNPDHPRIWPWIYRSYQSNTPQVYVRNPYYWAVDPEGNQLPYIDRIQFNQQDSKMLALSALNGQISMQTRHIKYDNYTELMSRQAASGIRIFHWYSASRSLYAIYPNLNRRIDPEQPASKWKARLLGNKKFRQALSLAINRQAIIQAEFNNQVEPAQIAPGRESVYHHEKLLKAFTEYAPEKASQLLDQLDLKQRDSDGFRTFPDGSRMVFYLDFCVFTGPGQGQFVVEDWARPEIGIRVILKECSRPLFYSRKDSREFDFNVWHSESDIVPLLSPRCYLAESESFFATAWGRWFNLGGFYGHPNADREGCFPPPQDHPMYQSMIALEKALQSPTETQRKEYVNQILDIAAENLWTINLTSPPPRLVVVDQNLRNVPENALCSYSFKTPGNAGIETFYFEHVNDSPGAIQESQESILKARPRPHIEPISISSNSSFKLGTFFKYLMLALLILSIALITFRHPYITRRLLFMIPTLFFISIIVFSIIQLPPGDYLTTRIMQLQESGDQAQMAEINDLKLLFHLEEPVWKRYLRWGGIFWFFSFSEKDSGLLQGNLGRSMESSQLVTDIVGDRILLTLLITSGTILFTWIIAIPIGIYTAVNQYSISDYLLTFAGFIGLCIPPFLLALILMSLTNVSGLFSAEFATQPEWDWPKFIDLLKHLWIPVLVLGVGGTAGMIRIMRANLIDELKKPYVLTAIAKGVHPVKLLIKYPVRMAINPFISGIGGLFPQLVSGGAIVAMVLSLPTVGPLLLTALLTEDTYLAASMLMILSTLGVFGTLISDLLLLWLDPRIRFDRGAK